MYSSIREVHANNNAMPFHGVLDHNKLFVLQSNAEHYCLINIIVILKRKFISSCIVDVIKKRLSEIDGSEFTHVLTLRTMYEEPYFSTIIKKAHSDYVGFEFVMKLNYPLLLNMLSKNILRREMYMLSLAAEKDITTLMNNS